MSALKRFHKELVDMHTRSIGLAPGGNGVVADPAATNVDPAAAGHVLQVSEWDVVDTPKSTLISNPLPLQLRLTIDPPPLFSHAVAPLTGVRAWPALVGVRLLLEGSYPTDYPFKPPRFRISVERIGGGVLNVATAAADVDVDDDAAPPRIAPSRTFADTLVVGSHPLDPAPWAPPSKCYEERLPRIPRALATFGPASFAAASLLQQSVRFRIELLGATLTQIRWRAGMDGFSALFEVDKARRVELFHRENAARGKIRKAEEDSWRQRMNAHQYGSLHTPVTTMDRRIVDAMLLKTSAGPDSTALANRPIRVKTLTGKTITAPMRVRVPPRPVPVGKYASSSAGNLDFDPDDAKAAPDDFFSVTLMHLQLFIYERDGVPISSQRLVHKGRRLQGTARYLETDFGIVAGDEVFLVLQLRGCPHSGLLLPGHDDHWSPALTLSTHLLPLINGHLYCAPTASNGDNDDDDGDAASCSAQWCRLSIQQLLRGAVDVVLRMPGGKAMIPWTVVAASGAAQLDADLFTDPGRAADRARIFDAVQWVLRCASPSPLVRWSPETDAQWPMLFRKIVRYVRRVRVPTPAGGGGATVLPLEVVERVGEFL